MNILEVLIRLRDDLKLWVTNNLLALKDEIDTKSTFSGSYEDLTDVPDFETQIEEIEEHVWDNDIHVTASDKTKWNNKSDFSGNYHDLEDAPEITDDGVGDLKFVDEDGNIIFKIDDEGIHTTNIEAMESITAETIILNGSDLEETIDNKLDVQTELLNEQIEDAVNEMDERLIEFGIVVEEHIEDSVVHVTQEDKVKWNNKSDFSGNYHDLEDAPEIEEDNAGDLKFVDEDGNIILQIDNEGLHTTNIEAVNNISAENLDITSIVLDDEDLLDIIDNKIDKEIMIVDQQIEDLISSTDTRAAELDSKIDEHAENSIVHVTQEDKTKWNNKSNFSGNYHDLEDAPEIEEDNAGDLKFVDDDGNIILTIDDKGLHTTNIEVSNNITVDNLDVENIALNSVDIMDVIDERIDSKIAENKASIETVVQVDITDGFLVLTEDKYQKTDMIADTEIILPTVNKFTEIHLYFDSYGGDMNIIFPDNCRLRADFNIESGRAYEIIATYNTMYWLVNVVAYS